MTNASSWSHHGRFLRQHKDSGASVQSVAESGEPVYGVLNSAITDIPVATVDDPQRANLDNAVGTTFRGKPVLDLSGVIEHIDSGYRERANAGQITYTFLERDQLTGLYNNPTYGFTAGNGVGPMSGAQRAEARQSIQFWDDLIKPKFVEKKGQGADIRFANSADPAQAYAYYPSDDGYKFRSDVFIADPALNWSNNWLGFNGYGATTLIHEIGHAIGLSHPGAYNFSPGRPLSYAFNAEYAQDSEQYSIMSYWDPAETGASIVDWSTFLFGNAQAPMLHDILTVQHIYGADPTTRTGNTTYGFNSNADRDVFDFGTNAFPNVAIYDAGGNDTIDLSGFNACVFINLHEGEFSSAGQAIPNLSEINANRAALSLLRGTPFAGITEPQLTTVSTSRLNLAEAAIRAETGVSGIFATEYNNIAIAYGTTIENAVGSSQRDLLWGNEVANRLEGRGGDDELNGFEGDDLLLGGNGDDTLIGGVGRDTFAFALGLGHDIIRDFLPGTDIIEFSNALFNNASAVLSATTNTVSGAVIAAGTGTITLAGLTREQLGGQDFKFV